jgi:DNA-binding NtrC family response regulator
MAHILIADDYEELTVNVARVLSSRGHRVKTSKNGADVLSLLANDGPFDLVILDMRMPILDGVGVLREMQSMGNETPVIVWTGDLESELSDSVKVPQVKRVIQKPWGELQRLLGIIDEVLLETQTGGLS